MSFIDMPEHLRRQNPPPSDRQTQDLLQELQDRLARVEEENAALRRRLAEASDGRGERSLRLFHSDTPVMLHSIDRNGFLLEVSNHWLEVLGYRRDEVIGRRSTDFLTPESRSYAEEVVLPQFFRDGYCSNVHYRVLKKSGEVFDVLLFASAERDAEGNVVRSMAVMTDVTEWKAAEKALKASEERFRMIVETSQEGIVAADAEGRLTYANRQFAEMLGWDLPEVIGRRFLDFVDDCLHEEIASRQKSREQGVSEHYETILLRRDGTRVWTAVSAIPVKDGSGEFGGSFAMISDVTRRKLAAEEIEVLHTHLSARACELEIANEELEAFSYTVSHDLRKPLTAINGFSQVVLEIFGNELHPKCRDYVQEILNGSVRMNHLIDTLLNFSRRQCVELQRKTVDLTSQVEEIFDELRRAEPLRKVQCVVQQGVTGDADEHLLRVVLDNLIGNAWKYCSGKQQGVIEFGMARHQGNFAYFVRDNGAGFDMKHSDQLFTPFQRLHDSREFQGTGIGLATVQRIIHRHGGQIWAEGAPGKGAAFYFTLG